MVAGFSCRIQSNKMADTDEADMVEVHEKGTEQELLATGYTKNKINKNNTNYSPELNNIIANFIGNDTGIDYSFFIKIENPKINDIKKIIDKMDKIKDRYLKYVDTEGNTSEKVVKCHIINSDILSNSWEKTYYKSINGESLIIIHNNDNKFARDKYEIYCEESELDKVCEKTKDFSYKLMNEK